MSDPLSVASGVAGLICLGSSACRLFYSFFISTVGAPSSARSLASALFSLNTSLGQVQEVLLDPKFIQQSNDQDILALETCLTRCAELFSGVDCRVRKSGLAEHEQGKTKKAWESVKWVFGKDGVEEALRRIADEKATLALVLETFTARMTAGILGKVEQLQVLARKHDRRLKDIHVWCQWAIDRFDDREDASDGTEYSGFTATQAYTSGDLRNLLRSSGSVLSLQIGDLSDDSVSMIWTPDSASAISPRRVKSVLSPSQPTLGDLKNVRGLVTDTSTSTGGANHESPLQNLADVFILAERSRSRRSRQRLIKSLGNTAQLWHTAIGQTCLMTPFASPLLPVVNIFGQLVASTKDNNQSFIEDLREIGDLITAIDFSVIDSEIEEHLHDLKDRVFKALSEYMDHAREVFKAPTSKQILQALDGKYEAKREQLVKNIKRVVKAYKFRHQVCTTEKLLRQQQEMIELKRRELELKEDGMKTLSENIQPQADEGTGPEEDLGSPASSETPTTSKDSHEN